MLALTPTARSPNVGGASCHVTAVEPMSSGRLAVQQGAAAMLHVGGVDGRVHVRRVAAAVADAAAAAAAAYSNILP